MITGLSHDLKPPLTAIQGTIKGLMDGVVKTPEQQQKFLEVSYKRTEEMNTLLNQLMYFSKLETGNITLDLKKVNICNFMKDYVEEKQYMNDSYTINLDIENEKEELFALIDVLQTQRVFDNFVENSIKHSRRMI